MYYQYSLNKGANQLHGYREADLCLCFRICKKPAFSRRGSYIFFVVYSVFLPLFFDIYFLIGRKCVSIMANLYYYSYKPYIINLICSNLFHIGLVTPGNGYVTEGKRTKISRIWLSGNKIYLLCRSRVSRSVCGA